MIKWFRKKSSHAELDMLFPPHYTDIHSHLLPGLDDGAPDMATALDLLGKLYSLGIRHFVCTPHVMEGMWNNTTEKILQMRDEFRAEVVGQYKDTVTVDAAAEYMIDDGLTRLIRAGDLLPVRDNLVLVEMSFVAPPIHLYTAIAELQVAGFRPLLAHPERYFFYHNDVDEYTRLKDAGCLFQLNLLALTNYYGKDVRKIAEKLLSDSMYDFTGTDLHHERHYQQLLKLRHVRHFERIFNF